MLSTAEDVLTNEPRVAINFTANLRNAFLAGVLFPPPEMAFQNEVAVTSVGFKQQASGMKQTPSSAQPKLERARSASGHNLPRRSPAPPYALVQRECAQPSEPRYRENSPNGGPRSLIRVYSDLV